VDFNSFSNHNANSTGIAGGVTGSLDPANFVLRKLLGRLEHLALVDCHE
jgi:hypothetical protein